MAFEFIQQLVNATRPDNREGRSLSNTCFASGSVAGPKQC